MFFKEMDFTF